MKCNYNIYCHCEGKARGNLEKSNWITSLSLAMTNKKPRNKSFWVFYGAGDGSNIKFVTLTLQIYILHPSNYGSFFALFVVGIVTHRQNFVLCGFSFANQHNKKHDNKCYRVFYGAGDGLQLEPEPNIYSEIIKELVHSSTVIFDIKTVLKYLNTN